MPVQNNHMIEFNATQIANGHPEAMLNWSKRWPNFRPKELACKHCGSLIVNYKALDALQSARTMARKPFYITSAYRCPIHNKQVGGAQESYHLTGRAFDIRFPNSLVLEGAYTASMIFYATQAGFRGFGLYPHFIHMDTGPHRTWEQGATPLDVRDDVAEIS